jgi:sulfatase modifying factor 1
MLRQADEMKNQSPSLLKTRSSAHLAALLSIVFLVLGALHRPLTALGQDPASRNQTALKAGVERAVCGIKLCWCPPGRFTMGSPPDEPERRPDEGQVEVTLTQGFWMAKYEVTQAQWKHVIGKLPAQPTAQLPEGDDYPVGNVNFAEAEAFCRKLTAMAHASGHQSIEFRLPTEAQWEYACRAGTTTSTAFGNKLSSRQANFKGAPYNGAEPGPSLGMAAKVGSYPANAWGLHDMHGNTFEWCRDWYQSKLPGGVDPDLYAASASATKAGNGATSRVRRGGCWADDGWPCRSAFRLRFEPERRYDHIGFRVLALD